MRRDPPPSELHRQECEEEGEQELGGSRHHSVFSALQSASEEHPPAHQHLLPRGARSKTPQLQSAAGVHTEVAAARSLPHRHEQSRPPEVEAVGRRADAEAWAQEMEEGVFKKQGRRQKPGHAAARASAELRVPDD